MQGCQLSAFLFLIFIGEIVEKIKKNMHPSSIGNVEIPVLLYGDDTALLSEMDLKRAIKAIETEEGHGGEDNKNKSNGVQ